MTKLMAVLLVLLLALVGAACGDGDGDDGANVDTDATAPNQKVGDTAEQGRNLKPVAPGKLTACSDIPNAPFAYEADGELKGIDIDVTKAVGGRLGLAAEFRDTDAAGLFAAMEAGQCDVVASTVPITEDRKKTVDFSDPYYEVVQSMLVRKADESKYTDLPTLRGRTVGVKKGAVGADFAKAQAGANGYTVKEFDGATQLFAALKSSQVDAVVQDFPVNAYNAKVAGDTVVTKKFEDQKVPYGIAMKKGQDALKKAINDSLARIRRDDTYNSIIRVHLGQV